MSESQTATIEPFSSVPEVTTDNGTHVEVDEEYLVKPVYIDRRLNATCEAIRYVPASPTSEGCVLTVYFRFTNVAEAWDHMNGKTRKVKFHDLDFVVGNHPRIRKDRDNCNLQSSRNVSDDYDPSDEPLPTPTSTEPSGFTVVDDPDENENTTLRCNGCDETLSRTYPTDPDHENAGLLYKCTTQSCEYYSTTIAQTSHALCDHEYKHFVDAISKYVCSHCGRKH